MAKRRVEIDIIANDGASNVFQSIRTNASSMSGSLISSLSSSASAVDRLDRGLRDYNNSMYRFNRVAGRVFRAAGYAVYNFTKDAINNFSALEQQHAKTMGAMATDYDKTLEAQKRFLNDSEKLKQQAITLGTVGPNGNGSLNTVLDVSYAQTALIKSGMSAEDILGSNAIESILKFAGGNDLSIDDASTFAVNLGTVFDIPVERWGEMLDMVTKAADISVIDVPDIMDSLTYTGGIASGLGRDLEEVLGIIAVMGQAGLRGRIAGTGLQAFFTRILSAGELSDTQIDSAPTEYVGQMYNAFIAEAVNADGSFKEMDEVAELLNSAMGELNDQEQAWFAKKLFGLYQMKAAYAITGSVDGDNNLITDFINEISNQSSGTNDIKYELMQASQYGKIQSLKNAWEGTKTDIGDRLSPVVSTIADELFSFLNDPQNYKFNWNKLREAFGESGDLIAEKYGEELGEAIENIGNLGIDATLIAETLLPQVGGTVNGIGKLLSGDISGAIDEFWQGIVDTNKEIDDLPPELQSTARAARDVIGAFTALSGVNLATQIAQIVTSAFNIFIAKPIKWLTSKISSTSTTVSSTGATVNTPTATVNIGQVPLMNVTATVVNVFGGSGTGNNPGTPTTPTTPQLPSGPSTPLLPSGTGGTGGAPVVVPILPSTLGSGSGGTLALPPGVNTGTGKFNWYGADSAVINPDGTVAARLYNGKTASQIFGEMAGKTAMLAAILGFAEMSVSPGLFDSADKRVQDGSDWLDRYVVEGNTDYDKIGVNARVIDYFLVGRGISDEDWYSPDNNYVESEIAGRTAARNEMISYYTSGEGAMLLNELFALQIEENGKITEEFLTTLLQWTKDGYTYTGSNEDIKTILGAIYQGFYTNYGSYEDPTYSYRFNDAAIDDYLKTYPSLKSNILVSPIDYAANSIWAKQNGYTLNDVSNLFTNIPAPVVNVNVTTNVDKNGTPTTTVDIKQASAEIARRSSQYGQTHMVN